MSETRIIEIFKDGIKVGEETYEVSDDALDWEQKIKTKESAFAQSKLIGMASLTVAEVENWIDTQVTDLASAKVALKRIATFCVLLKNMLLFLEKGS